MVKEGSPVDCTAFPPKTESTELMKFDSKYILAIRSSISTRTRTLHGGATDSVKDGVLEREEVFRMLFANWQLVT